jgi:ABC-type oligopeptide transport system substrate-binding subunit
VKVFCALACTGLAACGHCGFQPDAGIKIVVPAMPTTIDWSVSDPNSWANYPVALATMRGLTSLDPKNEVQPCLAASWERQCCPGGREVYTFHLRPEVRWSDGATPLTAQDFALAWKRAVQGRERGDMLDLLGADQVLRLLDSGAEASTVRAAVDALGVEAVDPMTLRVTLSSPRNYFLSRIANVYLFFPVPSPALASRSQDEIRDYFERPGNRHPLSLGPFRVESWDRAGERVRLVRNEHSIFAPALRPGEGAVDVVTMLKSEVGVALYDRGRVDFVFVDDPVALKEYRGSDLHREELLSTYFLAFNTQRRPLDRAEVRRALAASIDRAALLKELLPAARPATTLLPPGLPGARVIGRSAAIPDRSSAKAIIERAGAASRPLRLVYQAGESFIPQIAIAERLKSQLGALGIRIELEPRYDFWSEVARIAPDGRPAPDMYLRRIGADYAHPKTFFTLFERGGNHHTGWERIENGAAIDRFERLTREADAVEDISAAADLYARAEAILLDEATVIAPIYHPDRYYRARPRLVGLRVDAFNFLSLSELRVKN